MNKHAINVIRRWRIISLAIFLLGLAMPLRAAGSDEEFDYDIFLIGDTLAVWIDVRPVLDQNRLEDLLAGLDVSLAIDLKVERPRKLLFSKTLASARAGVVISHPLTEDYYRLRLANFGYQDRRFESQIELSDYLADSLIFRLAPISSLEEAPEVRLDLDLVSNSHSSNILKEVTDSSAAASGKSPGAESEFFESVFSFFLNMVGFGKTTFHIETPLFRVEDLPSL